MMWIHYVYASYNCFVALRVHDSSQGLAGNEPHLRRSLVASGIDRRATGCLARDWPRRQEGGTIEPSRRNTRHGSDFSVPRTEPDGAIRMASHQRRTEGSREGSATFEDRNPRNGRCYRILAESAERGDRRVRC